jgi:outer membrane protein OmpA-like peptidoglycan-associated protein
MQLVAIPLFVLLCCAQAGAQPPVRELHPMLPYIFFDSASAVISDRYLLLLSAQETSAFSETSLPSSSLELHHRLLDVIGSRMRSFSHTRVEIVGCNSQQPYIGEVEDISKKRGERVRDYLVGIWGIDSGRIMMLPPRDLPEHRSNPKDPLGIVENRRAEIRIRDWDLIKPIITPDSTPHPELADSTLAIYNLILFKFDSPEMGPGNERILKENIIPDLRKGARVRVVGYTDVVGLDDRNLKLSHDRAMTVVNAIKRLAPSGIIASIEGMGVGESASLYSNESPEGRFYNRCVRVVVTTPVQIAAKR